MNSTNWRRLAELNEQAIASIRKAIEQEDFREEIEQLASDTSGKHDPSHYSRWKRAADRYDKSRSQQAAEASRDEKIKRDKIFRDK